MSDNKKITVTEVKPFPDAVYDVTVTNGNETKHTVKLKEQYYNKLTDGNISPEELIRKSFEFLLEREPKEAILRTFELPVIGSYFPEYEDIVGK